MTQKKVTMLRSEDREMRHGSVASGSQVEGHHMYICGTSYSIAMHRAHHVLNCTKHNTLLFSMASQGLIFGCETSVATLGHFVEFWKGLEMAWWEGGGRPRVDKRGVPRELQKMSNSPDPTKSFITAKYGNV